MAKILHVVNIFFVVPYFIGRQFDYFNEKGHEMFLICSPSEHLLNFSKEMHFKYKEIHIERAFSPFLDFISLLKIVVFIKRNNIDIIVGHTPKGALLAMMSGFICGVATRIYFRHGIVYETMIGKQKALMIWMDRFTSYLATKVICVSNSVMDKSNIDKLCDYRKQAVLGSGSCGGIDTKSKFNPKKIKNNKLLDYRNKLNISMDSFVIGYVGRLVKDKGIIELVVAFERILMSESNVILLLVGDFEKRDALPSEIRNKIILSSKIIKTGFIHTDIEYYYKMMNVFILPSYREGFPISVLEASAMQLPIITTKSTGCVESIIENTTGIFTEISSEAIYDAILNIKKNNYNMGKKGRSFVVKNFDHSVIFPQIESIYLDKFNENKK